MGGERAKDNGSRQRDPRAGESRTRILDAAETLFAGASYAAVSMRDIASRAGVGLGAANYHFGSKKELFKQVFLRRARDLNRERARLLAEAVEAALPSPVGLRMVLDALLRPAIRWSFDPGGRALFIQFLIRCQADPGSPLRALFHEDLDHLRRFLPALAQALPDLSEDDILWRLHFTLGALHYTITDLPRLDSLSNGSCDTSTFEPVLERIIDYAESGFRGKLSG
uniref:TetR/AcrR family transcriptional regulator n=1 Tax=Stappia sp. TaxID=1870903 RepID=UPI003BAA9FC4